MSLEPNAHKPLFPSGNVERRVFLRGLSGLGLGLVLAGCSGGDGGSVSPGGGGSGTGGGPAGGGPGGGPVDGTIPVALEPFQGQVILQELNVPGLQVSTAWSNPAPVGADGSFGTMASQEAPQLVFFTDPAGEVRGLTLAVPEAPSARADGTVGRIQELFLPGALSTSASLVFLTPGFLDTNPITFGTKMVRLASSQPFNDLVGHVRRQMEGSTAVKDIARMQLTADLIQACIDFVLNSLNEVDDNGMAATARSRPSQVAPIEIELENRAWRCVAMVRQFYDGGGAPVGPPQKANLEAQLPLGTLSGHNVLPGAQPVAWGSLFQTVLLQEQGSIGSPGTAKDLVDSELVPPGAARLFYWTLGAGLLSNAEERPEDLDATNAEFGSEADLCTVVYYALFPIIDLALGLPMKAPEELMAALGAVASAMNSQVSVGQPLENIFGGESTVFARAAAAVDLIQLFVGPSLGIAVVGAYGTVAEAAALTAASEMLGTAAAIMGAANLVRAVQAWTELPRIARLPLDREDYHLTWLDFRSVTLALVDKKGDVIYDAKDPDKELGEYRLHQAPTLGGVPVSERILMEIASPDPILLLAGNNENQLTAHGSYTDPNPPVPFHATRHRVLIFSRTGAAITLTTPLLDEGDGFGPIGVPVEHGHIPHVINDDGDVAGTVTITTRSEGGPSHVQDIWLSVGGGAPVTRNLRNSLYALVRERHLPIEENLIGSLFPWGLNKRLQLLGTYKFGIFEAGVFVADLAANTIQILDFTDIRNSSQSYSAGSINEKGEVVYALSFSGGNFNTYRLRANAEGEIGHILDEFGGFPAGIGEDGTVLIFNSFDEPGYPDDKRIVAELVKPSGSRVAVHDILFGLDPNLSRVAQVRGLAYGDGGHIVGRYSAFDANNNVVHRDFLLSPSLLNPS